MKIKKFFKSYISFPEEKKQKILLVVLAFVILAIIFVVYFRYSNSNSSKNNSALEVDKIYLIDKATKEIDFDVDFLKYLDNLDIYGKRPSGEIEKGTINPFIQN